jgi:hypothetical protein
MDRIPWLAAMHEIKSNIQMEGPVPHIINHLCNQHPTLRLGPPQHLPNKTQRIRLYTHTHMLSLIPANLLHRRVLWPRPNGDLYHLSAPRQPSLLTRPPTHLDHLLTNIDKPRILHPLLQRIPNPNLLAHLRRRPIT